MSDSSSEISVERKSTSSSNAGPSDDFQKDIQSKYESNANKNCSYIELQKLNPHIGTMDEDILYHIALGNKSHDLQKMFKDVKFVVMGGTPKRMEQFAYFVMNEIGYELQPGTILNDISKHSHRYAMFKVGPVLSVSHGMGMPSIGILLHELIKLMHHAGVQNPKFFRIGTCGGFATKAGTVVVTEEVVNDYLESVYELPILGTMIRFPANLDKELAKEIISFASPQDNFESLLGKTYSTDSFYEGSGRADGAICEFSETESMKYYERLRSNGVVNVEMESLAFAALTCRAGIKSAVICVVLSDRLDTDQIKQPKEVLDEWQTRPQKLLIRYIKKSLSITKPEISATLKKEIVESVTKPELRSAPTAASTSTKPSSEAIKDLCSKPLDGPISQKAPKLTDVPPATTTTVPTSTVKSSSCRPILCDKPTEVSRSSQPTQPTVKSTAPTTGTSMKPTGKSGTCQPISCSKLTNGTRSSQPTIQTSKLTEGPKTTQPTVQGVPSSTFKTTKSTVKSNGCPISCSKSYDSSTTSQPSAASQPSATSKPTSQSDSRSVSSTTPEATKECMPCIGARESVKQYFSQEKTQESWRACYKLCGIDSEKSDSTITPTSSASDSKITPQPTTAGATSLKPATSGPATGGTATSTPGNCYCGPLSSEGLGSSKLKTTSTSEEPKSTSAPLHAKVKGVDSATPASATSSESRRSFYLECAKLPSCDTGPKTSSTAKSETGPKSEATPKSKTAPKSERRLSFFTPKQDPKTGTQAADSRPCCGKSEDIRSPKTCTEQQQYLEQRKEQEIDFTPPTKAMSKEMIQKRRASQSKPVDDPNALGPCCTKDFVEKPQKSVDTSEIGPCCLGLKEEDSSPECLVRTTATSDDPEQWRTTEKSHTESAKEPGLSDDRPVSRSTDDSPTSPRGIFKTLSCPLTIPCKSKTDKDDQSATTSEEDEVLPSPDTPDPSKTTRGPTFISTPMPKIDQSTTKGDPKDMVTPPTGKIQTPGTPCCKLNSIPAFITPTSTASKTSKNSCCLKFPMAESGQQVLTGRQPGTTARPQQPTTRQSAAVGRKSVSNLNKYDESPSPCAACKKYQETKNRNSTGTRSDSQPEVIKCPHKFKRLKEECEGYD